MPCWLICRFQGPRGKVSTAVLQLTRHCSSLWSTFRDSVTLQQVPSSPSTDHLVPPPKLSMFRVILKSHFAHLARYAERSEPSRIQIGKGWMGFHVFTKGHLFQVGSPSSSPSCRSLKSSNDESCRSQEQLYSLCSFFFPPKVPNTCSED